MSKHDHTTRSISHHSVIREHEADILAGYIAGRPQKSLAEEYGVSRQDMSRFIRSSGVKMKSWSDSHRRYALNQEVFDFVTDESAYWVGFLMADGCVSDGTDGRFSLTLSLSDRDIGHVEKFRRFLGSGQVVRRETRFSAATAIDRLSYRKTSCARIVIRSRKLVEALLKYGVTPRKSFAANVIGLEHSRNFWRGVIDGDGWITGNTRTLVLGLVGSRPLTEQFRLFVSSVAPGSRHQVRRNASNIYELRVSGRRAQAVIRHLYEDAPVSLDRKQELADEAMRTKFVDLTMPIRNDRINAIRIRLGLNQREAAKLAGVHFTYWNMVERNLRGLYSRVTEKTIAHFCRALQCSPEEILAD